MKMKRDVCLYTYTSLGDLISNSKGRVIAYEMRKSSSTRIQDIRQKLWASTADDGFVFHRTDARVDRHNEGRRHDEGG